jgi:outer membrane protein TolC
MKFTGGKSPFAEKVFKRQFALSMLSTIVKMKRHSINDEIQELSTKSSETGMKLMTSLRYTLAAILGATTIAASQESRVLTVDEAVQVGLANSKVLRQSQDRVDYADAKAGEVGASRLPSFKFAGGFTRLSDVPAFQIDDPLPPPAPAKITLAPTVLNNYNVRLSVQHPLFAGFKLDAAKDAADYTVDAATEDFRGDRSTLVYSIKSSYWNLFRAREFKKLADDNIEQLQAHLGDIKNLMDQGMATTNDMLAAEVQLSDAQLRQIDADNDVRLANISLDNTLGIPLTTNIEIGSEIAKTRRRFPSLDTLVSTALEARPEIRGMNDRIKAGEAGVTAAKAGWWPQVYLTGNYYSSRPNSRIQPLQDAFKDTWDVGVSVSLDIWNWGATLHQTDQAEAQLAQTHEAFGQIQDGVTLDVTQAYLVLDQARKRIEVARQGLARAEENHRVTDQRYKEGLVINSDMLEAQYNLNQAKTSYTQSLVDFALAEARLERAIGE